MPLLLPEDVARERRGEPEPGILAFAVGGDFRPLIRDGGGGFAATHISQEVWRWRGQRKSGGELAVLGSAPAS